MRKPTPLKIAIFHSGRTQRELAGSLGMDEGQFSRIVNGLLPSPETCDLIADELGATTDELWPGVYGGQAA